MEEVREEVSPEEVSRVEVVRVEVDLDLDLDLDLVGPDLVEVDGPGGLDGPAVEADLEAAASLEEDS